MWSIFIRFNIWLHVNPAIVILLYILYILSAALRSIFHLNMLFVKTYFSLIIWKWKRNQQNWAHALVPYGSVDTNNTCSHYRAVIAFCTQTKGSFITWADFVILQH